MANNAVLQRGFNLPEKTYKEENLIVPDFDWISIFIMISLWVLGTVFVSKLGIQIFPGYNEKKNTFILLVEILTQLLFISIILFAFQGFIFYPIIQYVHNKKLRFINDASIITATTVGVTLGLNAPSLSRKIQKLLQIRPLKIRKVNK
jgi:hypothetical protein|tara:strand:+ start:467 stop:910 length:444 start_codon:yes stop_codon:yes gene_type:complete